MSDRIYRFVFFSLYQREAMAEYLEKMAAKGWMLDKAGSSIWRFRRAEPRRLRIEVVFFPDASGFDPGPTPGLRTMEEYCARDGWTLLAQWGQAQIFMNPREDPVPIETDPVIQVDILHRAMKRTMLPAYFLLLVVILLQFGMLLAEFRRDPIRFLTNSLNVGMVPFWLTLLAAQVYELGYYFLWLRRARRAAEDGVFLPEGRARRWTWPLLGGSVVLLVWASLGSAQAGYLAVWCGCYAVILLLVTRARDAMKERGASRWVNRTVSIGLCVLLTFGFMAGAAAVLIRWERHRRLPPETYQFQGITFDIWHDDLPLTVADLTDPGGVRYSSEAEREESILLARTRYQQRALFTEGSDACRLDYTVVEVKAPFLYRLCRNDLLKVDPIFEEEYRSIDPAPWGAAEAYQRYWDGYPRDHYLLCFPDQLVEFRLDRLELTPERMGIIGERLKSGSLFPAEN